MQINLPTANLQYRLSAGYIVYDNKNNLSIGARRLSYTETDSQASNRTLDKERGRRKNIGYNRSVSDWVSD